MYVGKKKKEKRKKISREGKTPKEKERRNLLDLTKIIVMIIMIVKPFSCKTFPHPPLQNKTRRKISWPRYIWGGGGGYPPSLLPFLLLSPSPSLDETPKKKKQSPISSFCFPSQRCLSSRGKRKGKKKINKSKKGAY